MTIMVNNITSYSDAGYFGALPFVAVPLVDPSGNPWNLSTSNLFTMHLRLLASDPTVWLELDQTNYLTPATALGQTSILIQVPYSVMLKLPPAVYVHSLIWTDALVRKVDVWIGTWTHLAGATRT